MMGYAVGVFGMRPGDWEMLTPDEFGAAIRAYRDERESIERAEWERMRMLATITIQPYCRKKLTPKGLLPFPWERAPKVEARAAQRLTKEETRARIEELMRRGRDNQG